MLLGCGFLRHGWTFEVTMDLTWPGRTRTPSLVMQFPVQLMVPQAAGCCPNELGTACRCRGACQFLWLGLDQVVEVRTPRLEVSNFVMDGLGSHVHHAARFVIEFEIILCSVTVLFTFKTPSQRGRPS